MGLAFSFDAVAGSFCN